MPSRGARPLPRVHRASTPAASLSPCLPVRLWTRLGGRAPAPRSTAQTVEHTPSPLSSAAAEAPRPAARARRRRAAIDAAGGWRSRYDTKHTSHATRCGASGIVGESVQPRARRAPLRGPQPPPRPRPLLLQLRRTCRSHRRRRWWWWWCCCCFARRNCLLSAAAAVAAAADAAPAGSTEATAATPRHSGCSVLPPARACNSVLATAAAAAAT
eukprot:365208-Chlamydomonas_euryale.AAC.14